MATEHIIGIRREDKNPWERRVPVIPEHVARLAKEHSIEVWLEKSDIRVFRDEEYLRAGAKIVEDLSPCNIVLAIKEIPPRFIRKGTTYIFFSHTIKGQEKNMPMLDRIMKLGCQLIDYEKMVDEKGRRLVFFGKYAGLAGMIDSLWALGQKLKSEKIASPFEQIGPAHKYSSLARAKEEIREVGKKIASGGLPEALTPLVCGFAGYGNVSQGAQEILDLLPVREISPSELEPAFRAQNGLFKDKKNLVYKVVFKEKDIAEPVSPGQSFELQDYYHNPSKYRSKFERYIPCLTVLINCIYWDSRYPRLVSKEYLKKLYEESKGTILPRLKVIGDITCDVGGSIECTVRTTDPGNPVFVYDPIKDRAKDGFAGAGPVVLAVDNLPCELPMESSVEFSQALLPFIPEIAGADMSVDFKQCALSGPVKNAVIVYHGELTPDYRYMTKFLGERK